MKIEDKIDRYLKILGEEVGTSPEDKQMEDMRKQIVTLTGSKENMEDAKQIADVNKKIADLKYKMANLRIKKSEDKEE